MVWVSDQLKLEDVTGFDAATPIFAGMATGGLYKIASGPRGATLAAAIGSVASCTLWYGGSYFYNVILGKGGRY
jgi:hypothetical protein